MKYLVFMGIILFVRAAYIAIKIKNPENSNKYGPNPALQVIIIIVLGIVFSVSGIVGFVFNNTKQNEPQYSEPIYTVNFGVFADTETNHKIINDVWTYFSQQIKGRAIIDEVIITLRQNDPDLPMYRVEDYGWLNEIEINFKISKKDNSIYGDRPMSGNTLFYFFGGGTRPGLNIMKAHSAYFYGFQKGEFEESNDVFVEENFYKTIDDLVLK